MKLSAKDAGVSFDGQAIVADALGNTNPWLWPLEKMCIRGRGCTLSYKRLDRLFHENTSSNRKSENEHEAQTRLTAPSSFRTGIDVGADELFLAVPRELSIATEKILRTERKVSQLWRDLPGIACGAYVRNLIVDEVVCTNKMEGVPVSYTHLDVDKRQDAAHAGHAHEGGGDVEASRARPAQRPSEKRDDHAVQRCEERAVRGGGVGESRGVEPVGEE